MNDETIGELYDRLPRGWMQLPGHGVSVRRFTEQREPDMRATDDIDALVRALIAAREAAAMSIIEVARKVKTPISYVLAVEQQVVDPSARFLILYAKAVRHQLDWTLGAA